MMMILFICYCNCIHPQLSEPFAHWPRPFLIVSPPWNFSGHRSTWRCCAPSSAAEARSGRSWTRRGRTRRDATWKGGIRHEWRFLEVSRNIINGELLDDQRGLMMYMMWMFLLFFFQLSFWPLAIARYVEVFQNRGVPPPWSISRWSRWEFPLQTLQAIHQFIHGMGGSKKSGVAPKWMVHKGKSH